jgi:KUP system potassium uptake protein
MAQGDTEAPPPLPDSSQSSPAPSSSGGASMARATNPASAHGSFWTLVIGSIGVVYGDIGTSPLYAFKESISHVSTADPVAFRASVIGVISLIFWSLMIVVTAKYVMLLMRLDNKGEGGTLSLMALAQKTMGGRTTFVFVVGMLGAGLFYGDAILTPAISVLSAVEGLREVPGLGGAVEMQVVDGVSKPVRLPGLIDPFILPIGIVILLALFAWQSRGTGRIGNLFGPVCLLWFLVIGGLGIVHIRDDLGILQALSPVHGVAFVIDNVGLGFVVLGSVFLAVTGAEALYADMGHFGRRPINRAWLYLVLPCLMLNYFGQGAMVLKDPSAMENPFFRLAPDNEIFRGGLVLLAMAATVIASQAVITGAFSLTQQAIQLGLLPRMEIRRTSETQYGQIYMPQVNWMLLAGVIVLIVAFRSSSALASAYGIAVIGAMITSSLLAVLVIWKVWKQPLPLAALIVVPFLFIEAIFFSSNMLKLLHGGFVPLLLAATIVLTMWTWVRGTRLLAEQTRRDEPLDRLFETLSHHPPHRVRGTAIFLTGDPDVAPAALMHNLKHNQVLHESIIILTVKTLQTPRAPDGERLRIEEFMPDVKRVTLTFGFMETPNVVKALTASRKHGLKFDIMKTSFFLSRRTIIPSEKSGMPIWQDHLFIFLARNATNATDFFHIPSGRAVELGNQVMV